MVGADQIPAPEGPNIEVPTRFFPVCFDFSGIMYVFHARDPSRMCNAVTLPRNVQHGYSGFSARVSSQDAAGTNTLPLNATGAAVNRAPSGPSSFFFPRRRSVSRFRPQH